MMMFSDCNVRERLGRYDSKLQLRNNNQWLDLQPENKDTVKYVKEESWFECMQLQKESFSFLLNYESN